MKTIKVSFALAVGWLVFTSIAIAGESGFARVPNGRLYYETAGTGDAIVFIHGNAGDRRHWDHQVPTLAKEFRVIRYDVRGFGRSPCPEKGESYADHVDLAGLLDHLGIKSAHIAGWSMGSGIAIDFALAYPDRAKSLISIGPWIAGFYSPAATSLVADMRRVHAVFAQEGQSAAVRAWMKAPFFSETIRETAAGAEFQRIASDYTFCRFFSNPAQPLNPSAVSRAGEIRVPTLILTADHDIPACLEVAELIERSVSGSRKIVMAGTGHLLHMEKPAEFNEHLMAFLRGVAKRQ